MLSTDATECDPHLEGRSRARFAGHWPPTVCRPERGLPEPSALNFFNYLPLALASTAPPLMPALSPSLEAMISMPFTVPGMA